MTKDTPQIRFKGFTDAWEQRKLGDVAKFYNEQRIPIDSSARIPGKYPYYGATGIIDYVHDYIFNGEYVLLAEDGANIVSRNSPIAYLTKEKFWLNNHAHIMRMPEGDNTFLLQCLEKQNYIPFNTGTAQPKLNAETVKNIGFSIPQKTEQTSIGNLFRTLDKLIALQQRKLEAMQKLKQGYLQQLFPQEGETVPRVRFAGFDKPWEVRKLDEVAIINPKALLPNKFQYVDLESVVETELVNSRAEVVSTAPSRAQRVAKQGDIFYQTVRPYQRNNYLFDLPCDDYVFSTGYAQLRPYVDGRFLFAKLQGEIFVQAVLRRCTGTSYPAVSSSNLATVEVLIPEESEQVAIGNLFHSIDAQFAQQGRIVERLQALKRGYLQRMFV